MFLRKLVGQTGWMAPLVGLLVLASAIYEAWYIQSFSVMVAAGLNFLGSPNFALSVSTVIIIGKLTGALLLLSATPVVPALMILSPIIGVVAAVHLKLLISLSALQAACGCGSLADAIAAVGGARWFGVGLYASFAVMIALLWVRSCTGRSLKPLVTA